MVIADSHGVLVFWGWVRKQGIIWFTKLFNEILKYKKMQNESRSKLERDKTYELCCEIKGKGDWA